MKRVERNKRLKNIALKISIVYNNCNKSDITSNQILQQLQQIRYYIKPNITSKYQAQSGSRAHFSVIYQSRPMNKYQSQPMAKYQSQPTSL
jgi:hypothetical protein